MPVRNATESGRPAPERDQSRGARLALWLAVAFVGCPAILLAVSYLLDPTLRSWAERNMNARLKGYETRLGGAHLNIVDGTLTLRDVTLIQKAQPQLPVAHFPIFTLEIQWRGLFNGHVVADLFLFHPSLHINLAQLRTEYADKLPLSKKGWQDAIESIYPFKINHFTIEDGEAIYVDTDPNRPLRLEHLYVTADNIRNIRSAATAYPSPIQAEATVFDVGQASIEGRANFLTKPVASVAARYHLENVPLKQFKPVLSRINFTVEGGTLASDGFVEYGPRGRRVEVYQATIAGARFAYTHAIPTAAAEAHRVAAVKAGTQKINNAPETLIKIDKLEVVDSQAVYINETQNPHYRLSISNVHLGLTNLSNRFSQGSAHLVLRGRFMDSGLTTVSGDFRAEPSGSDFDLHLAIRDASLPSLNNLLRAYGRFDVQSGQLSVFSQVKVRRGVMKGYVKTLFSNVNVYDPAKDKNKSVLHQAYELAVGAAAKVVKNSSTQKVATKVDVSGKLDNPNVSTWQALVQFVQNGFVNAILPGFDRQTKETAPG
jgi:uncharacterized protein DUF748